MKVAWIGLLVLMLCVGNGYAATVTWDGDAGDSAWSTAENWDTDEVPGGSDDVVINDGDDVNVSGNRTVASLQIDGTLNHTGGDLAIAGASTIGSSGTLDTGTGWLVGDGTLTIQGTLKKGSGTGTSYVSCSLINSNGTIQVDTGTLALDGSASLTNGTYTIASGAKLAITSNLPGSQCTISGTLGGELVGTFALSGGKMSVDSGSATLNFTGAGFIHETGYMMGSGTLTNTGTIHAQGPNPKYLDELTLVNPGTYTLDDRGIGLSNGATIQNTGTFDIIDNDDIGGDGSFINTGVLKKSADTYTAIINLPGFENNGGTIQVEVGGLKLEGTIALNGGTYTVAPGAGLYVAGGVTTSTVSGTLSGQIGGTFSLDSGTLTVDGIGATFAFSGNGFSHSGGTIDGTGTLTNTGAMRTAGGSFERLAQVMLVNQGTFTHAGRGIEVVDGATFINNALFDIVKDIGIRNEIASPGTGTVINRGTFRKSGGANPSESEIEAAFENDGGTIQVQVGQLQFSAVTTLTGGTYTVAAGATLNLASTPASRTLSGTLSGQIDGTFSLDSGTLTVDGSGATFAFSGNGFTHAGGTIDGTGTLTNTGAMRTAGGSPEWLAQVTLDNQGTFTHAGRGIQVVDGATLINSALFDIVKDIGIRDEIASPGTGTVINRGTFRKSGGANPSESEIEAAFENDGGTIQVDTGTLELESDVTLDGGTYTVTSGATLSLTSDAMECTVLGTLSGAIDGTFGLNGGVLTPGTGVAYFAFTGQGFEFAGGTINGSGTLINEEIFDITGTGSKRLGEVTLASEGTLTLSGSNFTMSGGADINNSGTFNLAGNHRISAGTGSGTVTNSGTFAKSGGDGTSEIMVPLYATAAATVSAESGVLSLKGGGIQAGALSAASGAKLAFTFGAHSWDGITGSGQGDIEVSGATVSVDGTSTAERFIVSSGALSGPEDISISESFTWNGGTMSGTGETIVGAAATMTAGTSSFKYLDGRTLTNQGTAALTQREIKLSNDGHIVNSGTFEFTGGSISGNGTLLNTGTLLGSEDADVACALDNSSGTIQVDAGTLDLKGATTLDSGTYTVATGASLTITGSTTMCTATGILEGATDGTFGLYEGTLTVGNGTATFDLTGNGFTFHGGTLAGTGTLTNTGTIATSGSPAAVLSQVTLANEGTLAHSGGSIQLAHDAMLRNTATFDITGNYWVTAGTGSGSLHNSGIFKKSGGTGRSEINVPFDNSGTVQVDTGELRLQKELTLDGGTYDVAADAALSLYSSSVAATVSGGLSGTIWGEFKQYAGSMTVDSGGASFAFSEEGFEFGGGTLDGSGTLTNTATYAITGNGTKYISEATLANQSTLTIASSVQISEGGAITNSGRLEIIGDRLISAGTNGGTVTNTGTLLRSSGTDDTDIRTAFVNDGGTVQVDTGTFDLEGETTLTGGTVTVAPGATVTLSGSNTACTLSGTLSGTIDGALALIGGALTVDDAATLDFSGNGLDFQGGTINGGGTLTNASTVTITGTGGKALSAATLVNQGTITYRRSGFGFTDGGTLENEGTFDIDGDRFISAGTGSGSIANTGTFRKSSGTGTAEVEVPFDNDGGTIEVEEGTLYLSGTLASQDGSSLNNGSYDLKGTLRFAGGGVETNRADITLDGASAQILDGSGANGLANFASNAAGASFTIINGRDFATVGVFANAGALVVGSGCTWTAGGALTQTAGSISLSSGTLAAGGVIALQGGSLLGVGTVNAALTNASQVVPGNSPGVLDVTGDYAQTSGGTLVIEIGGTTAAIGYDVVNVTGTAALDGTLQIDLIDGFTPAADDVFQILNHGARSGQFTSVTGSSGLSALYVDLATSAATIINEPVLLATNTGLTLGQGATATVTTAMLQVTDADGSAAQTTFTLTAVPAHGTLNRNGGVLAAGGTFSQQEIDDGLISYTHDGSVQIADGFTFTVADGQGSTIAPTGFAITVSGAVVEAVVAGGLSGATSAAPTDLVQLFGIGLTGSAGTTVNAVGLTLSDLSTATGLTVQDIAELRLYRSADAVLNAGDTQIGTLAAIALGSVVTVPADTPDALSASTVQYYLVAAVLSGSATDGHALRVGFAAGGVATSIGGRGTAVTASDGNHVRVDVVATQLVFTTQPAGAVFSTPLTTQPVVAAQDDAGRVDLDFSETVTLAATADSGGGSLSGDVDVTSGNGVATFTDIQYDVDNDQDTFHLVADDQADVGTDLAPVSSVTVTGTGPEALMGDVNRDGALNLIDAIMALKLLCGEHATARWPPRDADCNGDGMIGIGEPSYILQKISTLE